jgi:hypothetical protein
MECFECITHVFGSHKGTQEGARHVEGARLLLLHLACKIDRCR